MSLASAQPADYPAYYRADRDYPHFGLWEGDLVRYGPDTNPVLSVVRYLPPDHNGLTRAIAAGVLTDIAKDPDVVPIRSLQSSPRAKGTPSRQRATVLPLVFRGNHP